MKATDLRIGNLFYYRVVDQLDERKEWFEVSKIDASDLAILEESLDYDYQPIPINEEWLLKFGFEKQMMWTYAIDIIGNKKLIYYLGEKGWSIGSKNYSDFSNLNYVHQLQNLYFALTGVELIEK
jgi:hypothetical protein